MKKRTENPLQGKMFMSAREIMSTHDPNEPDRFFHGTEVSVSRASSYKLSSGEYATPETDEQLYSRKLAETKHRDPVTQGAGVPTFFGRIRQEGVQMPIMLSTETKGRTGKPNVAGGHHRLAVMANLNSDQLMPVMPVNNVLGAHSEEGRINSEIYSRKKQQSRSVL